MKPKAITLKKIYKINELLARLSKKKRGRTQVTNTSNKSSGIITDSIETKRIKKE